MSIITQSLKGIEMQSELLTTDELSARIKYDVRTIRERLKDSVLRIPLIADTHSSLIADSIPGDRGRPGWGA
jgi:hypothetical protein